MDVPAKAIRTLMEMGVAATGAGLNKEALAIFEGIEAVRPHSEGPAMGVALLQMNTNGADAAVKMLREEALVKNPNSLEAKMLLGLALRLAGRSAECDSVIKELQGSGDAQAKAFAESLAAR